ncbi:MAG: DUF503 domain-containing protein [Clostridia bacterium]|nr:DUF503 domain-containing protein [Clostridia bacterium]
MQRTRQRFNVAIAETDEQDRIQTLVIGIAVLSSDAAHARDTLEKIILFLADNQEAELMTVRRE